MFKVGLLMFSTYLHAYPWGKHFFIHPGTGFLPKGFRVV